MSETPPPDHRTAPLALWRIAQTFLHTLHALFGDPSRIAFQHTLTKEPYDLLLSWIRCGEAMMRRLLLIEARRLSQTQHAPAAPPQAQTHTQTRRLRRRQTGNLARELPVLLNW
jgi:hypothetical protein